MSLREIDRDAVEATLREFDERGRMPFLARYGYNTATKYLLRHQGRFYDPKAVAGVAVKHTATAEALKPNEFDATQAIATLTRLGFEVLPFTGLWWVNQGESYGIERDGGFVWAPQRNKAGHPVAHHTNVNELRVEQRIVHYANNYIRAIGTVREAPVTAPQPEDLRRDTWINDGYLCPVDYLELDQPIYRDDVPDRLNVTNGPFDVNGNIKQGYMFPVPADYLLTLLAFLNERIPDLFSGRFTHSHHQLLTDDGNVMVETAPNPIIEALLSFKNVALEGVPGTGKSHAVEEVVKAWRATTGRDLVAFGNAKFSTTVLHPSSSYEDFVEGLRPSSSTEPEAGYFDQSPTSTGAFGIKDGFFLRVCSKAVANPDKDVIVLLDELNRCNVPSVFGDLLLTLEKSRRATFPEPHGRLTAPSARDWVASAPVDLPYSGRKFFVPDNVYIIATMNTTDRSIAPLDAALRRRFAFRRMNPVMPTSEILTPGLPAVTSELFDLSSEVLRDLNQKALQPCLGPDSLLGHSYLWALAANLNELADSSRGVEVIRTQWRYAILPQLIDSARSFGAEDLVSPATREGWLHQHSDLEDVGETARLSLAQLDDFLDKSLGLRIVVEGTGLSRGARIEDVVEAPAAPTSSR